MYKNSNFLFYKQIKDKLMVDSNTQSVTNYDQFCDVIRKLNKNVVYTQSSTNNPKQKSLNAYEKYSLPLNIQTTTANQSAANKNTKQSAVNKSTKNNQFTANQSTNTNQFAANQIICKMEKELNEEITYYKDLLNK
tara:strand:+ start:78 stop:485 length:408 start_codon:yes stop_codon:yes gene_type:complete